MASLDIIVKASEEGINRYKNNYAHIVRLEQERDVKEEEILMMTEKYTYYPNLEFLENKSDYLSITSTSLKSFKFKKAVHTLYNTKININDLYLIKSCVNDSEKKNRRHLQHEYFIAANSVNILRETIPNFAHVTSYITDKSYKNENGIISFQIIEKVEGDTLRTFIQNKNKCTIDIFLQILSQIILSINTANESFGFMHNNLTCDNIIVWELPDKIHMCYKYNCKDVYICSKYIPIIMNYEKSRIIHNNKVYGINEPRLNIDSNVNYPFSDIYKIFMDSFGCSSYPKNAIKADNDRDLYHVMPNLEVYKVLNNLIDYFTNDNSNVFNVYYFIETNKRNFILPYLQHLHGSVWKFFEEMYNRNKNTMSKFVKFNKDVDDYIYGFNGKYDSVINDLNWNSYLMSYNNIINDPYYLLESYINSPNKKIIHDGRKKSELYYNIIHDNILKFYNEVLSLPYNNIIKLVNSASDNIKFKSEFVNLYVSHVYKICKIRNILDIIFDEEYLLNILIKLYPDVGLNNDNKLLDKIHKFVNVYYNPIIRNLEIDMEYLKTINIDKIHLENPDVLNIVNVFENMKLMLTKL